MEYSSFWWKYYGFAAPPPRSLNALGLTVEYIVKSPKLASYGASLACDFLHFGGNTADLQAPPPRRLYALGLTVEYIVESSKLAS